MNLCDLALAPNERGEVMREMQLMRWTLIPFRHNLLSYIEVL